MYYGEGMIFCEQELDVMVSACNNGEPFVVIVNPRVVSFRQYNTCFFIEGGLIYDRTRKSAPTFF